MGLGLPGYGPTFTWEFAPSTELLVRPIQAVGDKVTALGRRDERKPAALPRDLQRLEARGQAPPLVTAVSAVVTSVTHQRVVDGLTEPTLEQRQAQHRQRRRPSFATIVAVVEVSPAAGVERHDVRPVRTQLGVEKGGKGGRYRGEVGRSGL